MRSLGWPSLAFIARAEDVADLADSAVSGIEMPAAIEKLDEFGLQVSQMPTPVPNVSKLGLEESVDVAARRDAIVPDVDDACDLGERQSRGLRAANELQSRERDFIVDAVAVLGALGLREESPALVEPNGSGRDTQCVSNLADQHQRDRTSRPSSMEEGFAQVRHDSFAAARDSRSAHNDAAPPQLKPSRSAHLPHGCPIRMPAAAVSVEDRQSDAVQLVHDGRPADSRSADHERDDFDGVVAGNVREEGDIGHDDA